MEELRGEMSSADVEEMRGKMSSAGVEEMRGKMLSAGVEEMRGTVAKKKTRMTSKEGVWPERVTRVRKDRVLG